MSETIPPNYADVPMFDRSQLQPEHIMQFFEYAHLPPHLATISHEFAMVAGYISENIPRNPERTVALRKLLEAKDAAVRARLAR